MLPIYLTISGLSLAGFSIAVYVHFKKRTGETMVCPVGAQCDAVIHSPYSRFFGIPVELFGMGYYALIGASYLFFVFNPTVSHPTLTFILLTITTLAFLFSVYLTFIQAFSLQNWCTWCLSSAAFSTLIFILAVLSTGYEFLPLLAAHEGIFLGVHMFGLALGLGGATISDILFFTFLKDLRISETEADILHTLSQVIWFGLALLIISGAALYLPGADHFNESAKFLVKMIVVGVIIVNGAVLNLLIAPNLVKISFSQQHHHEKGELHHLRRLAFALGAISVISWYSAFILAMLRSSPAEFWVLLGGYVGVLIVGIIVSQIVERHISSGRMLH